MRWPVVPRWPAASRWPAGVAVACGVVPAACGVAVACGVVPAACGVAVACGFAVAAVWVVVGGSGDLGSFPLQAVIAKAPATASRIPAVTKPGRRPLMSSP